uniref:Protein tweety homolog n=1 Tax=Electrophorus electricus TaxID=8005 RepID=A0A4W4FRE5_ELEEL
MQKNGGIGFYGNSEANDGMYQLTSSLLTANYTLASINLLVRKPHIQTVYSVDPLQYRPCCTERLKAPRTNTVLFVSLYRWLSYVLLLLLDLVVCLFILLGLAKQLLTQSQRALSSIHSHLFNLERDTLPRFPKAEKPLREVQQMLNITEGNFHQLVALLRLCYDGMEGLLYLSLYSFLSALAFTAILCSLPGAWRSFARYIFRNKL